MPALGAGGRGNTPDYHAIGGTWRATVVMLSMLMTPDVTFPALTLVKLFVFSSRRAGLLISQNQIVKRVEW